jgi:hypothetical protein
MGDNNNEQAFPSDRFLRSGMTLRDYFAAKAMAAMLSIKEIYEDCDEEQVAKGAYAQADAMIQVRQQKKDEVV